MTTWNPSHRYRPDPHNRVDKNWLCDGPLGGGGHDIIVSNMAATMPGGYGELPRGPNDIKGEDNVVAGTSGANILRWFVVRGTDGSWLRVERAHVKNPGGGEVYVAEGANDQDVIDAGDGNDYVWAGRGSDYIMGGAGDDHLAGLGGGDVIMGGAGKDVIYGDEWARMRLQAVTSSRNGDTYGYLPVDEALKSPALHGNDVIDGGADDDEIWGDGGDDIILGGTGKDVLYGDALLAQLPYDYHGKDRQDGSKGCQLHRIAIYSRAASAFWAGARGRFGHRNRRAGAIA